MCCLQEPESKKKKKKPKKTKKNVFAQKPSFIGAKQLIHSPLLDDTRSLIANPVLHSSLAIYHFPSNTGSWNERGLVKKVHRHEKNQRHIFRKELVASMSCIVRFL